ncbi:organoarsenical effux MFS transporter ArsJ [Synechococcus sp. CS-1325]|uniref:organoarsenical effux MFS transporter ArsJ n=1 Tax=unclassified Synechococcus TaxID=2626047 RepID=UPI0021A4F1FA|nr:MULTISPECIES: organoarsenical effux MFS transporter ArsJ [unclassified Synechococcus]MCT0199227.1 organoarsenical effux MFS transporter ArsJ [Synechococcus sp. CS-1325]MCT0212845.1 organoarsenical effux MFS transporter ArsJ [Synechococcus sp. CS-1326]MCT0232889.1 organoarsenical effux MFS transporter ArsJ [Synechococcus sp. CS-1327]
MKQLTGLQQYAIVTANYWAFTLTDGALRMLVVFHFHQLGYTTLEIAFLFLFYEFFGILTNLYGGWLGARFGLRLTLWAGTLLQVGALLMLIPVAEGWPRWWSVAYVMLAQAISGIAKDLNKMSAKSAIKTVVPETPDDHSRGEAQLFKWVAILTGSKNALKGVGFFLGGVLLATIGFNAAVAAMAGGLFLAFLVTLVLPGEIGRMKEKPAFTALFSKSKGINVLSTARFFLFGARDVWFVVALPVFLQTTLGWRYWEAGGFMGLWVIGYGIVQGSAPALRRSWGQSAPPGVSAVQFWSAVLTAIPALIAVALWREVAQPGVAIVVGLAAFGVVFAMNSSIHSYMVLAYTDAESVSLNVGFYYMANAAGRLVGTLLSGALFLVGGLQACLWASCLLVGLAFLAGIRLPPPLRQQLEAA